MSRDRIYALPQQRVGDFAFDDHVAEVFPDMIARSVPGYASVLSMIEQLSIRFVQPGTNIYDLGCSLGAATRLLRAQAPASCTVHAVDSSEAMVSRLRRELGGTGSEQRELEEIGRDPHGVFEVDSPGHWIGGAIHDTGIHDTRVEVHAADIRSFPMSNASFVVLNWTLQFVPAVERERLLQAIATALNPGGALLLSEKICFDDGAQQELLTELHHDFKRAHGYSELEIAQKRTAIEKRLIPETLEAHVVRLKHVGFEVVTPWFQCFNFVSILAIK